MNRDKTIKELQRGNFRISEMPYNKIKFIDCCMKCFDCSCDDFKPCYFAFYNENNKEYKTLQKEGII